MFKVELKRSAKKELDDCHLNYKSKIIKAIKFLQYDPYPFRFYDVRKVKGRENVYGIRIGNTDFYMRFINKINLS